MGQFCSFIWWVQFEDVAEADVKWKNVGQVKQHDSAENESGIFELVVLAVRQKTAIATFAKISKYGYE